MRHHVADEVRGRHLVPGRRGEVGSGKTLGKLAPDADKVWWQTQTCPAVLISRPLKLSSCQVEPEDRDVVGVLSNER